MWEFLKTMLAGLATLCALAAIVFVVTILIHEGWRFTLVIFVTLGVIYGLGHVARFGIGED